MEKKKKQREDLKEFKIYCLKIVNYLKNKR